MSTSEMVQPTQGDREAAARVIDTYEGKERYAAMVRAGARDSHPLCIAFARYRVACVADGREEAAKVCDTYAEVNFETAGDAVLLDPVLRGQGFTPENVEQSQQHQTDMLIHTSYFHAGQHLATAIRALGDV